MPRNGSNVYSLPAGSIVADGQTISASQHNDPLNDLVEDANTARAISVGGTGATSASDACLNLGISGIGRVSTLIGNAGVTNNTITPGVYRYDTTAGSPSSGGPTNVTKGTLIHSRSEDGTETQLLLVIAGTTFTGVANTIYVRSRVSAGAWDTWEIANAPVITSWSDGAASGFYELWPNGKYEIWGVYTTDTSASSTTFPVAFAATPRITFGLIQVGNADCTVGIDTRNTTTLAIDTWVDGARVTRAVDFHGFGKWY